MRHPRSAAASAVSPLKIGFVASSGGHLKQLQRLSGIAQNVDSFWVTEELPGGSYDPQWYLLPQINRRELLFPIKLCRIFWHSVRILTKERPDVIISTGALASVPIMIVAKLTRRRVIFIESFAKVHSPTLTGRLAYKIADCFYIQWDSLRVFYPNAVYAGSVF